MDYARLIETGYPGKYNWEEYPLKGSAFYLSKGVNEHIEIKEKKYFPSADAQVVVIIHEDHKKYYSSQKDKYRPFILPGA